MLEIIYTLIVTHITIICVTLFLHRGMTHKAISFHPVLAHFMRLWLWLTTGMNTKAWVAIHRRHHQKADQPGDPHSPHVVGIWTVFLFGGYLYTIAARDKMLLQALGQGTPDDWIEKHVYTPHPWLGIIIMATIDLMLFGWSGLLVWAVQMLWIPFWAAGVVNGLGHWWGYRNGEVKDKSTNLFPIGIIIGGEELHNNHHIDGASPKFSRKWFEFDLGWLYICILEKLGLVTVRK